MKSNEVLFGKLNKQFTFYLQILRWGLWPFTLLALIAAIYLGYDLSNTRNELNSVHFELKLKKSEIELLHREIIIENKEFNSDIKLKYTGLLEKFDSLNTELSKIFTEHNNVIEQASNQLKITSDKYNDLLQESKSLEEFSNTIKSSVDKAGNELNKVQHQYMNEIELAKIGADEKLKIANKYMDYNLKVFNIFRQITVLNSDLVILETKITRPILNSETENEVRAIRKQQNEKIKQINDLLNSDVFLLPE